MFIIEVLQPTPSDDTRHWFSGSKVVNDKGEPLPVYHGTNQPIDKFNLRRGGASTRNPTALKGFYFTDNPDIAADYASNAGRTVRAEIAKFEKETARLQANYERLERVAQRSERNEDWQAVHDALAAWENLEIETQREDPMIGQNVIPVYLRIINPLVLDAKGNGINDIDGMTLGDAILVAKKAKNDGLIIRNLKDAPSVAMNIPATHYVVFSPKQIRSVFAHGSIAF